MTLFGTRFRYGPIAQAFHWVMAALVILALVTAVGDVFPLHEGVGITVFTLTAFRLLWRSFDRLPGKPPMRNALARWSWRTDLALYVLLFAVPIMGLIGSHELQAMAAGTHPGVGVIDLHRLAGVLLFLAAGLHSAFALYHHYGKRDGVMQMMLPGGPPAKAA